MKDDPTVTVTINDETVIYHLRRTSAPVAYDGFGTFTVYQYDSGDKADSFRIVAIRSEHVNWQTARYSSGNFASPWPDEWMCPEVTKILWKRLQGKENE